MRIGRTPFGIVSLVLLLAAARPTVAVEHRVEVLKERPPAELAPAIAARLGEGVRVIRGASRVICDIWLFKEWEAPADKPASGLLYPFQPGQMLGVVRFPRKASDFRNQDIAEGLYTLRYAHQPVDGAHVGTSLTRDFLLLTAADQDMELTIPDYKSMTKKSAAAAGSSHPALLSLQAPTNGEKMRIRHVEEQDWWVLGVVGARKVESRSEPQTLEIVVVGHAAE